MHRNLMLLATFFIGLFIMSPMIAIPAHATQWVGNDDGEFDWAAARDRQRM